MKILHVTRGYGKLLPEENPGAIESVILNISKSLVNMGHEVTIIDRKFDKSHIQYVDGVKIIRLDTGNINIKGNRIFDLISSELDFINFALKTRKFIKESDYDIIHVHTTMVGLSLAILNKDAQKMVYTSHNSAWSLSENGSTLEGFLKYLDICLMKRVNKVMALGHDMKSIYISKGIIPEKIFVVHNGVDTNFFNPNNMNGSDVKHLNIINNKDEKNKDGKHKDDKHKDEKFNILFVGRIDKIKGINYLIKAMDIIVNKYRYNDIQCLIVGPDKVVSVDSNEDIDLIVNYIKDKNLEENIKFLGELSIDDLKRVYNLCDVFVLPSIAEAAPLTVLEAMAFGKPVICSKIGAVPEYVTDKFNGLLVKPKDEMKLAENIKYIYDNPHIKEIMGKNNLELIKGFDWNNVCIDIANIYKT